MTTVNVAIKSTGEFKFSDIDAIDEQGTTINDVTTIVFDNVDVSAAQISTAQAIAYTIDSYCRTWRITPDRMGRSEILTAAARIYRDAYIRTHGRAMVSKYDGTDEIGREFKAGTDIIWFGGDRFCDKGTVVA